MGQGIMEGWKSRNYDQFIGYGIGQYYEKTKKELAEHIKLDYLCDRKWEAVEQKEFDGIRTIKIEELERLERVLVVIFAASGWTLESIKKDLKSRDIEFVHVDEVIGKKRLLEGRFLKTGLPGESLSFLF